MKIFCYLGLHTRAHLRKDVLIDKVWYTKENYKVCCNCDKRKDK